MMDRHEAPYSLLTKVYFGIFCGAAILGFVVVLASIPQGWGILIASLIPLAFAHMERRGDIEKFETETFE